jgi:outer membrane protein
MKKYYALLFFLPLFSAGGASAKDYQLADCFTAGTAHDYKLAAIADETDRQNIVKQAALASFTPEITAEGTFRYASAVPEVDLSSINPAFGTIFMGKKNTSDISLTVNEVIFSGCAREYAVRLAERAVDISRLREQMEQDSIRETILQLAYSCTLAQLNIDALDAGIQRLTLDEERMQLFYQQGLASEYDVLGIQTKKKEQEIQKQELENARSAVFVQIASLTGFSDITSILLPDSYMQAESADGLTDIENRITKNTSLLILQQEQAAVELARKRDTAAFLPVIAGSGTLHYADPGLNYTGDEWQSYYTAGISVSMNIWDKGQKINTLRTDALSIDQAENNRREAQRSLLAELQQDAQALRSFTGESATAASIFADKQKQYDLVTDLWKKGQKTTLDVLTAEQELTAADIRVKNLHIQYLSLYQRILFLLDEPLWKNTEKGDK